MRKMVKGLVFTLSAALLLSACGGQTSAPQEKEPGQGQAPKPSYTFKLAHIEKDSSDWNRTAEKFNEELKARSDGRLKADVFPGGQLGSEADMFQQMSNGSTDFVFTTGAYMSTRSENFNAWFMPFLFENVEEASKARHSNAAKEMLKELEQQGVVGMDYIFAGNHNVLMKSGAVNTPDDVKGKKFRVIGNPAIQEFWIHVGASPTPIPLPEVYSALQSGTVDGIHMSIDGIATSKFYEVAKDLTLLNQIAFPAIVSMSKQTYDKLSEEDRKIVEEAMSAAVDWGIAEVIKNEQTFLEEIKSKGTNVYEVDSIDPGFVAARDAVYKTFSDKNPLIKSFIEENQK